MSWGFWCSSSGSMCVNWCATPVSVFWIGCVYLKTIQRRRVNVSMYVWPPFSTNPITSLYCGHRATSADCGACVPAVSEFRCVSAIWIAYISHIYIYIYICERPPKPPTFWNSCTRTLILDTIMKLSGTIGVTQKTMTLDTHVRLILFQTLNPQER